MAHEDAWMLREIENMKSKVATMRKAGLKTSADVMQRHIDNEQKKLDSYAAARANKTTKRQPGQKP